MIRSDERVSKFLDSEKHASLAHTERFISDNLETYESGKGLFWGLIERSSNNFIGDLAFWRIDIRHSRAEIGYTLKPEYWGRGYMKEAMTRIIQFGYDELNIHSIEANINPKNENSRALLLKMGFKKEAYFRENYFYNGEYLDTETYSLLRQDLQ